MGLYLTVAIHITLISFPCLYLIKIQACHSGHICWISVLSSLAVWGIRQWSIKLIHCEIWFRNAQLG